MKINGKKKKSSQQQYNAYAKQLQEHCKQAWTYLKKNSHRKLLGHSSRSWILLLGTTSAGKTSLLRGTSLPLQSPHKTSLKTIKPTQLVDWWVSPEAVFIDPASEMILPSDSIEETRWKTLLKTIQHYRMMHALNHAILIIDLPHLITLPKDVLTQLSLQLQNLQDRIKKISVSVIISKCDQLDGFTDMFDDMNTEERQQIFGITFTKKDRENGLISSFSEGFFSLVSRLKVHLLSRMHHEQCLEKRRRIFAFPTKFSTLSASLETLITHLPFNSVIPLQGIYFTSVTPHRTYFTESTIQSILNVAKHPSTISNKYASRRLFAFPIASAIIFGLTLLWHTGYNQTIRIINEAQEALASTSTNIPQNFPWLSELNILGNVLKRIQQHETFYYESVGLLQTAKLKRASEKEYQSLLQSQLVPYLKSTLLEQIQLGIKGDKLALFDALKTYLSVTQKEHYDKNIITNWYRTYWKAMFPNTPDLQIKLENHLVMLLTSKKILWSIDKHLVEAAQTALKKLPLSDLAFLELQGEYESTNNSIFPSGHLEGISLENATVPSFFSTAHFQEVFNKKIAHIGKTLAKGNWVLGTTKGVVISTKQEADIAKKIQKTYLEYYTQIWAATIPNILLQPATNYSDVLQRIHIVLNERSDLTQLLKLVIGHSTLQGNNATNKNVATIKTYLDKKDRYSTIQKVLMDLKNEIQNIQKSKNPNKASYVSAESRFKQTTANDPISAVFAEANQNPEPIRSWLNTIALSSWKSMLDQTRAYLNDAWKTTVLPVYRNEIENRYPVFSDSREDTSLKDFNAFFGPEGTIGAYFINYLQPFVNMTKNYWTWKSLNGAGLNITQDVLNTFIRASIIQQMFFTDNHDNPSFRFILAPLTLSENVTQCTMNIGGQLYNVYQKSNEAKQFFWPGSDPRFVSIQFITSEEKNPIKVYNGPWSWFRMLDANSLQTTADPQQFTLTLQSGSHSASFRLLSVQRVNPMVPGIIGKYRCPESL